MRKVAHFPVHKLEALLGTKYYSRYYDEPNSFWERSINEFASLCGYRREQISNSSWHNPYGSNECRFWHYDFFEGNQYYIVAYPNPTQFLVTNCSQDVLNDYGLVKCPNTMDCHTHDQGHLVDRLIADGWATIKEFELGDIVEFTPYDIHRTNPKSVDKPRLCLRFAVRN